MDPERVEFIQRHEDKPSLMKPRMWNGQPWFVDPPRSVEEDVEIHGSRAGPMVVIAPERTFNFLERFQEAVRGDVGLQLHHSVEKPFLSWIGPVTNRFRLVQ